MERKVRFGALMLARLSHRSARRKRIFVIDQTNIEFFSNVRCVRAEPDALARGIAALKVASLALHSTHSYCCGFRSRAARSNLSSSASLAMPLKNAG
jgi:hypothetical protein